MTWDARQLGSQTGRTFVVTGANSGLGLETARALVQRDAHVVLAVRDVAKGEQASAALGGRGSTSIVELDLADLDSVAEAAKRIADEHGDLAALVCNAGLMGGPFGVTAQGFERQMGTNHLGHAALVAALWPQLKSAAGRVVAVSSLAARGGRLSARTTREQLVAPSPYLQHAVYANTKQANLLFVRELHRRAVAAGAPVSAVAVHPGISSTNLFARQLQERRVGFLAPLATGAIRLIWQDAAAGALSTLRALDRSTPSGALVGPGGFGQFRGAPELHDMPSTALDDATAGRLWQLTEELIGTPLPV
ncbi:MAG TPA: SDR family NAD(P)-dependent oxidoreductase [Mycobacteriales bacterium]|nr:SDR family NAD(P)-dependent oxidoreductase [Mycobacteriales bacterium]